MDERTQKKEILKEGRIKVLLNNSVTLPLSIRVWVEDVRFTITVENADEDARRQDARKVEKEGGVRGKRNCPGRRDDDDISPTHSKFKSTACYLERNGLLGLRGPWVKMVHWVGYHLKQMDQAEMGRIDPTR